MGEVRKRVITLSKLKIRISNNKKGIQDRFDVITQVVLGESLAEINQIMTLDERKHLYNRICKEINLKPAETFKIDKVKIISNHGLTTYKI